MKVLFGMALRQTTGFVESLLRLVGLDWSVPDFSTLSRRQKTLAVCIPCRGSHGPLKLLVDGIGIGAEGEGEWHARKHGGPKRRLWRKSHVGIDEQTLEIRAIGITGCNVGDAPRLPYQIPADVEIGPVTADGAHGTRRCHDAVADRGAHLRCPTGDCKAICQAGDRRGNAGGPGRRDRREPDRRCRRICRAGCCRFGRPAASPPPPGRLQGNHMPGDGRRP